MKDRHFNLLRWLPTAASMGLMILIAIVSGTTVSELKKATYWREHTFQVILDAQIFEDKLIDAQSRVHGCVGKRQANLLIQYRNDTNVDVREIGVLTELTGTIPNNSSG